MELGKRLLSCAKQGDTEGVRQLMSRGAPFTTDWLGTSPLHLTAQYGKYDTCEVLLRAGCSRDARTKVDKTPLHVAAQEGQADICELLLKHGAEVDAQDMLRMTALHWAVERGCRQTVELLVRYGANTNLESKFDKTVLELATESGRPDIFDILRNCERVSNLTANSEGLAQDGVGRQEVVHAKDQDAALQFIKTELDNVPLQTVNLDPIQIALSSAGEENLILSSPGPPPLGGPPCLGEEENEALKLLASHGITMLPNEEDSVLASQSIELTEAGKLALSLAPSPPSIPRQIERSISLPISSKENPIFSPLPSVSSNSKVVTLQSTPVKSDSPIVPLINNISGVNQSSKAPKVIKLTAAQFAAIKRGKSGQIVLPGLLGAAKKESSTISLARPSGSKRELEGTSLSPIDLDIVSQPARKVIRLDVSQGQGHALRDKFELQKQLQKQLEAKSGETERLKQELQKRQEEEEKLKAQIRALSC